MSVNASRASTAESVTSGTRSAAAACSLKTGTPASQSSSSDWAMSSNCTDWWQMSKTTPRCRRTSPTTSLTGSPVSRRRVAVPVEDQTSSRNQSTVSAVVSRKQAGSGSSASLTRRPVRALEVDEVCHHGEDVLGQRGPVRGRQHLGSEGERRGLDGRRHVGRADLGEDVGDLAGVADPVRIRPVGLVHLLHHDTTLERAVGEGVDGVDVHVVLVQPDPQTFPLARVVGQRLRRRGRQAERDGIRRVGRHPPLHGRRVGHEAVAHLRPGVARVHEGGVREVLGAGVHDELPLSWASRR